MEPKRIPGPPASSYDYIMRGGRQAPVPKRGSWVESVERAALRRALVPQNKERPMTSIANIRQFAKGLRREDKGMVITVAITAEGTGAAARISGGQHGAHSIYVELREPGFLVTAKQRILRHFYGYCENNGFAQLGWQAERVRLTQEAERIGIAIHYKFQVEGVNRNSGEAFSWVVPNLDNYDLSGDVEWGVGAREMHEKHAAGAQARYAAIAAAAAAQKDAG